MFRTAKAVTSVAAMNEAVGIDVEHVTQWFQEHVPGAAVPLDFLLIAGGRSNLTFKVTDGAGHAWVLRRPPTGHALPADTGMATEHRIISALAPSPVPVPPLIGLCTDSGVNGEPFYVMGYVDGHVLRDAKIAQALYTPVQRRAIGFSLVGTLADLHAVDVDGAGLGHLGDGGGYVPRQLQRWYGEFKASTAETGRSVPAVDSVHDRLLTTAPVQQATTIVHGDYRLDNVLLDDEGAVAAVLDWEMCTLGDPLADLGLLLVHWPQPADETGTPGVAPTTAGGFPTREEMKARYGRRTGRDLGVVDYYVAFAYWKLACVLEGVFTRYAGSSGAPGGGPGGGSVGGSVGGDQTGFDALAVQVGLLAEAARATLG